MTTIQLPNMSCYNIDMLLAGDTQIYPVNPCRGPKAPLGDVSFDDDEDRYGQVGCDPEHVNGTFPKHLSCKE